MLKFDSVQKCSTVVVAVTAMLLAACGPSKYSGVVIDQCANSSVLAESADDSKREQRETMSASSEREQKFQSLVRQANPQLEMAEQIDQLFTLLSEANRKVDAFDRELDLQLAHHQKFPQAPIDEPTRSPTYMQLTKMSQLSAQYEDKISYFYSRLLESQVDMTSTAELRDRARLVGMAVETQLKSARDLKRAELQPLVASLLRVHRLFLINQSLRPCSTFAAGSPPRKAKDSREEAVSSFDLASAVMSESSIQKLIASNPNQVAPPPVGSADQARHDEFVRRIEADLATIPDPVFPLEAEHSTDAPVAVKANPAEEIAIPAQELWAQSMATNWGSKIFPSTGDSGNINGANFPSGVWAFTFDDGPAPKATGDLITYLNTFRDSVNPRAKATFFWMASHAPSYPNWVKFAYQSGYPFENHSFTHKNLALMSSAVRHHEVVDANDVLSREYRKVDPGYQIKFYRCPYGACFAPKVPEVRQMIASLGLVHVYWRIDSLDWKLLNGPRTAALVEKQMQLLNHGVILMHDIHPPTVDAVKIILPWMKDQNDKHGAHYKMVTIPEAVDMVNAMAH